MLQTVLQFMVDHSAWCIGVGATAIEFVLRLIPGAKPLTKIAYESLGKVIADKK